MRVIEKQLSGIDVQMSDFLRVNCSIQWGVIYAGAYQEYNGQEWEHDKWFFTFTRIGIKKSINFEYHTGVGCRDKKGRNGEARAVKPEPAEIIYGLIMDGSACSQSFVDWCADFGYDTDSRKALAIYEACQQGYNNLQSIFTHAEIAQLQTLLEDY